MKLKQIVAIIGIIGLLIGIILPFLNYNENGERIQSGAAETSSSATTESTGSLTGTATTK